MNLNNFSKTIIEKYVKNFLRHHDLLRIVVRMPKTRKLHTNEDILLCILIWLWNFRSQNVSWCLRKIILFFLTYFPFSRIKRLLSLINQKVFKICHIFGIQTTAMYFFIIRSLWIMHPTIGSWVHYPKEIFNLLNTTTSTWSVSMNLHHFLIITVFYREFAFSKWLNLTLFNTTEKLYYYYYTNKSFCLA